MSSVKGFVSCNPERHDLLRLKKNTCISYKQNRWQALATSLKFKGAMPSEWLKDHRGDNDLIATTASSLQRSQAVFQKWNGSASRSFKSSLVLNASDHIKHTRNVKVSSLPTAWFSQPQLLPPTQAAKFDAATIQVWTSDKGWQHWKHVRKYISVLLVL